MCLSGGSPNARVLSGELRGALVADAECGAGDRLQFRLHEAPGLVQPQTFLVLQRRRAGDGLEVGMEGRVAHADRTGEISHHEWPFEIVAYDGDRVGNARRMVIRAPSPIG